jgi:hypothetical protein
MSALVGAEGLEDGKNRASRISSQAALSAPGTCWARPGRRVHLDEDGVADLGGLGNKLGLEADGFIVELLEVLADAGTVGNRR